MSLQGDLSLAVTSFARRLMRHRERYLRAWVAATGIRPEACELHERIWQEGGEIRAVVKAVPRADDAIAKLVEERDAYREVLKKIANREAAKELAVMQGLFAVTVLSAMARDELERWS